MSTRAKVLAQLRGVDCAVICCRPQYPPGLVMNDEAMKHRIVPEELYQDRQSDRRIRGKATNSIGESLEPRLLSLERPNTYPWISGLHTSALVMVRSSVARSVLNLAWGHPGPMICRVHEGLGELFLRQCSLLVSHDCLRTPSRNSTARTRKSPAVIHSPVCL